MNLLLFIFTGLKILFRQLRLSVSSVSFYKDVYKNYHGYGIKYLFVVSFIPSIIYCIFILNYLIVLKDYFNGVNQSAATENIEYIINQLPEIQYKNSKISVAGEEPVYLYSKNGYKVVVIDTKNQLSNTEKDKIPFVLTASKIILNLVETNTRKKFTTDSDYSKIFNLEHNKSESKILTPEIIKKYCADNWGKVLNGFIYVGMPFIVLSWFITFLFEKCFIILLVYIVTNLLGPKTLMKTCIRLVMFSSGVPVLLQPVITLLFPSVSNITILLQIFTTILLFNALWQIKNKKFSEYF